MKTFIAVAMVALVAGTYALTTEQKAKGEEHAKVCIKEVGVAPEDVGKLKAGDFSNKSEKVQCFAKCFLEKSGVMKDGAFQADVATQKLSSNVDKAKVEHVVNACKNTKGANPCETAFKIYECYHQHKAELA